MSADILSKTMDVKYINPFIKASMNVFSTFAGITPTPGPPSVRNRPMAGKDITGFIGLNGHGINGYFTIKFSSGFLTRILSSIFSHGGTSKAELFDLAGELTNMISGAGKAELSQKGYFFDVAVPVISDNTPPIPDGLKNKPVIVVPFDTPSGSFHIEACIQRIEEDFQQDTTPEIPAPAGHISVDDFAAKTRMAPVKVRRLLKTGYLSGEKISLRQWHIPKSEILKIQGHRPPPAAKQEQRPSVSDELVSVEEFSRLSGLSPAKIKNFLRTGFLKGLKDENKGWKVQKTQVSKFNRRP